MSKCYILVYRKRGTKERFRKAGPYVFPKQSMFGDIRRLRRQHPTMDLMFRKVSCRYETKMIKR